MLQGMMGRMHRIAATHKTYPSPRAGSTHAHQMRVVGEMARIKMATESSVPMEFLQRTMKPSFASTKKKACMRHNMQDSEWILGVESSNVATETMEALEAVEAVEALEAVEAMEAVETVEAATEATNVQAVEATSACAVEVDGLGTQGTAGTHCTKLCGGKTVHHASKTSILLSRAQTGTSYCRDTSRWIDSLHRAPSCSGFYP